MSRPPRPRNFSPGRSAFTLLELLVVISVLALLGVLIAKIISATSDTTRISNRSVDAASQARLAFDRLSLDLGALLKRADSDFLATNPPASPATDCLKFLSGVTSAGVTAVENRGVSLVAYQVGMHPDHTLPCLLRAGKAVKWNQAGLVGFRSNALPVQFSDSAFPVVLAAADYDIVVPGVIRLIVGFQLYPDDQAVTLAGSADPLPGTARGQIVYAPPIRKLTSADGSKVIEIIDLKRISALVIGLVAIDEKSLKFLNRTQTESLAAAFTLPDATFEGAPMTWWNPLLENVDALPATVPLPARQGIHVFQRAFPMTPFGSPSL